MPRRWKTLSAQVVVTLSDITERKEAEAQRLAQERQRGDSHKLEAIGTLAGGIAHDFNNILAAILGNLAPAQQDLASWQHAEMKDGLPNPHPVSASLEQINRAALRARDLVQQILSFSRQDAGGFKPLLLAPVVEETLSLLRSTLPAGVRLDAVLPAEPLPVHGDSTQLQQVLLNLCTNAWHALPAQGDVSGRIEIGLEAATGERVHLWVRDNGSGMDEATRQRIFDPFFTTKTVGQGTGLGLSVVHGIVGADGGIIALDTAPGQGSTFHLYLPRLTSDWSALAPVQPPAPPPRGGGQHVLYIDDDEVMVLMVERLLQRAGFRVRGFSDATLALAQVRAHPDDFDAVVTDFNLETAVGRTREGGDGTRWQGATTLRAHAREEEQRGQRVPAPPYRVRSAVTLEVKLNVGANASAHAASPADESGQLPFLGSTCPGCQACRWRRNWPASARRCRW